jgi:hypothetical protein
MTSRLRLIAAVLSTVALAACAGDPPASAPQAGTSATTAPPSATTTPGSTATATASARTSPSPGGAMRVAVYYLGETKVGPRLYREFRTVPQSAGVVRAAVDTMLHLAPLDPDYKSVWPKAATVRGVGISGSVATVDLSANARTASAGSEAERLSLQQLVHTVTAAAPAVKSVQVKFDGAVKDSLWGHVSTKAPIGRSESTSTLGPVWVIEPGSGTKVARTFTASGVATVFEATVSWSVTPVCAAGAACKPIKGGFVNASIGAPGRGTWKVTVTLPATTTGDVVFTAWESSAEDGSVTFPDSKRVRIA